MAVARHAPPVAQHEKGTSRFSLGIQAEKGNITAFVGMCWHIYCKQNLIRICVYNLIYSIFISSSGLVCSRLFYSILFY